MNKSTRISIIIALVILLAALAYIFKGSITGESFELSSKDSAIVWQLTPLSGITKEDVQKKIDTYQIELAGTPREDKENRYNVLLNIAAQYENLGDGKKSFEVLNEAVSLWPERSIAYMGIGSLLEKAKALYSAQAAYEIAVSKEPQFYFAHLALIDFYIKTKIVTDDDIKKAFDAALLATGDDINVLKGYASWTEEGGTKAEAIALWEKVLKREPSTKEIVQDRIRQLKNQ